MKAYKARLVLFPRKTKSPKDGESSAKDYQEALKAGYEGKVKQTNRFFPIDNKVVVKEGKLADYKSEDAAYRKLREARSEARLVGKREKRAKLKEEQAAATKK